MYRILNKRGEVLDTARDYDELLDKLDHWLDLEGSVSVHYERM